MPKTMGMTLALALTLAAGVAGQGSNALRLTLGPEKKIWLEGTSTVRRYTCQTQSFEAVPSPAPSPSAPLANAVKSVQVTVPVKTLSCGNGTMDEHLRKALKAEENPDIRFELRTYEVGAQTAEGTPVKAEGTLTIAGQTKPIELAGTVTPTATGLRVQGQKQINMTEWGVKPPKLMLGTLKVAPAVTIHYDVVLEK